MVAVPLTVPVVAVITAVPAETPETSPDPLTVATETALVVQVTLGELLDVPSLRRAVADSWTVCCVLIDVLGAFTARVVTVGGCVGGTALVPESPPHALTAARSTEANVAVRHRRAL